MGRSLVAGVNALFRAAETLRPEGERILEDAFAHLLAERDPRVRAVRYGRFAVPPLFTMVDQLQTVHCVRHRSLDELILRAVRDDGFEQVVVIGAGYDMRPTRLLPLAPHVRWIEADHPLTAKRKWHLLSGEQGINRDVQHVAVDLSTESLDHALLATGFDPGQATVFVAEGLIHYLSMERFEDLLRATSTSASKRRLLFSFIRTEMYAGAPNLFVKLVQLLHEVPDLHFTLPQLAEICARHGFPRFRSWTLAQQIEAFAPQARGRRAGVSQDVAEAE